MLHLREALHDRPKWKPLYNQGPRIESVPAVPYKFLDIGTQMGEHYLEDLIPRRNDLDNILAPSATIVQESASGAMRMLGLSSSPTCDFWVTDAPKCDSAVGHCRMHWYRFMSNTKMFMQGLEAEVY